MKGKTICRFIYIFLCYYSYYLLNFFPLNTIRKITRPGEFVETVCGSPLYMAPEVLQFQRYDNKVPTPLQGRVNSKENKAHA